MFSYLISIAKIIVLLCVFQKIYLNLPPISPSVTYEVTDNISTNNQLITFTKPLPTHVKAFTPACKSIYPGV